MQGRNDGQSESPSIAEMAPKRIRLFVSYSRVEQSFVRLFSNLLEQHDATVWVDWEDIRPTEDWLKAVFAAIESSDVFVFVITPESCSSRICQLEINHAVSLGKKIVPILRRPATTEQLPEAIAAVQWVSFTDDNPDGGLPHLLAAVETDLAWVKSHTIYLERALEWERHGRASSDTLRGARLLEAERWLEQADAKTRVTAPIHQVYIRSSRKTQTRVRAVLVSILALAGLSAVAFGWQAWVNRKRAAESHADAERSRLEAAQKERESILAEIKLDQNSRPSPLNLSRRRYLDLLLQRATNAHFEEGRGTLERLAKQVPPESAQRLILAADASRQDIITPTVGDHLFVSYPDRIEAYGPAGELIQVYHPGQGRIIWAAEDPRSPGLLYEVEYPDFSDRAKASQIRISDARRFLPIQPSQRSDELTLKESEVIGSEREVFLLSFPSTRLLPVALTRKLEAIKLPGDAGASITAGYLYRESLVGLPTREQLVLGRYWDAEKTKASVRKTSAGAIDMEIDPLGYDFQSGAVILEIREPGIRRTFARPVEYQTIWAAVIQPNGRTDQLTKKVDYTDSAAFFRRAVPALNSVLNLTDVRPRHRPATVRSAGITSALISDTLVEARGSTVIRLTKMEWTPEDLLSTRFTPDGRNAIAVFRDRSVGLYDCANGRLIRRFPAADSKVRTVRNSADGRFVYLFDEDGRVTRWETGAFGADGWARANVR